MRPLRVGLLVLLLGACAGPERSPAPVPDSTYVEVMARLSRVRSGRVDPDADSLAPGKADSLRRRILEEHGVSASDLEQFARVVGDEPARMQRLWERIRARVDSLQKEQVER